MGLKSIQGAQEHKNKSIDCLTFTNIDIGTKLMRGTETHEGDRHLLMKELFPFAFAFLPGNQLSRLLPSLRHLQMKTTQR